MKKNSPLSTFNSPLGLVAVAIALTALVVTATLAAIAAVVVVATARATALWSQVLRSYIAYLNNLYIEV